MDNGSAIERLEQRVAHLEAVVRVLAKREGLETPAAPASQKPPASPAPRWPDRPADLEHPATTSQPKRSNDLEQWVGQRGLLMVGVLALLATGAFLLKYAFDRGWISPSLRVAGAVIAGAGVMYAGERFIERGLRRYGAALIGAGGGLAYLGCWAAAGPYALVERNVGLGLLVATAVAVALFAVRHGIEALCTWALLGAYLAPICLPHQGPPPQMLYGYLAVVAVGAGLVAFHFNWRATFGLTLLGYLLLPSLFFGAGSDQVVRIIHVAAGGVVGLLATAQRRWPESRLAALALPWLVIFTELGSGEVEAARWTALAGGAALVVVACWQERSINPLAGVVGSDVARDPAVELLIYVTAPLALVAWAGWAGPTILKTWGGAVPAGCAALYLVAGWPRRIVHLVGMGFTLSGLAISGQWDGTPVVIGWIGLGLFCIAADRWLGQRAGRGVGLALLASAFIDLHLSAYSRLAGPGTEPAFAGVWDAAWYAFLAGAVLSAWLWPVRDVGQRAAYKPGDMELTRGGAVLWGLAGGSLFLGGTLELHRLFLPGGIARQGAELAADLSISAFWLVYAGALVATGFRLDRKPVRVAGLALAGLAALKITLFDLSNLEALYRIASFFTLALITLAVAYAYNRPAKGSGKD